MLYINPFQKEISFTNTQHTYLHEVPQLVRRFRRRVQERIAIPPCCMGDEAPRSQRILHAGPQPTGATCRDLPLASVLPRDPAPRGVASAPFPPVAVPPGGGGGTAGVEGLDLLMSIVDEARKRKCGGGWGGVRCV